MQDKEHDRFDLDKLSQYIVFVLNMQQRTNGKKLYHKVKFRYCTIEDFEKRGVEIERESIEENSMFFSKRIRSYT